MQVKLLAFTPEGEKIILNIARVSTPSNRGSENTKLIKYLIDHGHWSPFEHASLTIELNQISRAIGRQIIRHRSFTFQEYSQRYSEAEETPVIVVARRQATKNRQSSVDDLPSDVKNWFNQVQESVWKNAHDRYKEALSKGIAKECARFLLPESCSTTLIMTGNIRSYIHYLQSRLSPDTQQEHREIAIEIAKIFEEKYPIIYEAAGFESYNPE